MMKRIVAAIAVASLAVSLLGSSGLAAEGETPSVKGFVELYGQARLSLDAIDTGSNAPADKRLTKVSSNSSRLGFRGSEDLGDGLSAVFQVELGVNMDGTTTKVVNSVSTGPTGTVTGTGTAELNTISLRNTYAGLKSQTLGTLLFGIHDTPYKMSTGKLDAFADTLGDYNAVIGSVNGSVNFDLRPKDEVLYMTPVWSGLQFSAARSVTGSESSNGAEPNASATSAALSYSAGPLYVSLAREIHENGITSWDAANKISAGKAGVSYEYDGTKLSLVFEAIRDDKSNSKYTRNAHYLALSRKFGSETLKIAYGAAEDGDDPATSTGATHMTAGIDHLLSKRTTLFALYTTVRNDKDATYGIGTGGSGGALVPAAGKDPSALSFGLSHSF